MEARNLTYGQQQDVESHAPYLRVFLALLVLTVLEYFYARLMAGDFTALVIGLTCLAVIKVLLVGLYFMHVKFEGKWVFLLIVPATILATVLVLAMFPDIGMRTVGVPIEEQVQAAPAVPDSPLWRRV